jgi:hypothetical protein
MWCWQLTAQSWWEPENLKHHVAVGCHNVLSAGLWEWSDWHLQTGCMVGWHHYPVAAAVVGTATGCGMDWGQVKGDDVMELMLVT